MAEVTGRAIRRIMLIILLVAGVAIHGGTLKTVRVTALAGNINMLA